MMHTLLYQEMNQAVPGVSLSPGHESGYGECQVPSPSQWSDPCYSPPSFHSPQHLPGELEKVKEEPFSPPPPTNYLSFPPSPPTSLMSLSPQQVAMSPPSHLAPSPGGQMAPSPPRSHPPGPIHGNHGHQGSHHATPYTRPLATPKKEGFEASLNIADLLAENQSLTSTVPQVPSFPPSSSPSYPGFSPPSSPPLYSSPTSYPDHPLLRTRLEDAPKKAAPTTSTYTTISQDLGFLDSLVDVKKEVPDVEEASPGSTCGSPAAPSPGCSPTQCQRDILETVEKLALEHARRDVLMVSESLNIPCDPAHWSVEDVKKWLKLQAAQLSLPPPMLDFWNLAGPALLKLTEAQFRHLAPVGGELLYAQLEIWREALRSSPKLHVHHHYYWQLHDQMLPQQPQQQQQPSPQPQQYQPQAQSPRSIGLPQVPTPVAQVNQQQAQQQQQQGSTPTPQQQQQQQGQGQGQQQQGTVVYLDDPCVELTSLLRQNPPEVPSTTTPSTTTSVPAHSPHDDPYDSDDADEEECVSPGSGRGATHIHLWQFLKELLQQPQLYGSCIRWLDRQKGVFKIEDSVRVARLWGKRKNRPAMNYDKLSRSIRQYYKKGIMKKTERSQRLVYQFCHPYCL